MREKYFKQTTPFLVPTTDGKTIEEHFGLASSADSGISIAHMIAPPGWSEPHQRPEFDEYVIMIKGKKLIEIEDEKIELHPGQTMLIKKNSRVRYSNPFDEEAEYWSVCVPAFSPETVHRE